MCYLEQLSFAYEYPCIKWFSRIALGGKACKSGLLEIVFLVDIKALKRSLRAWLLDKRTLFPSKLKLSCGK